MRNASPERSAAAAAQARDRARPSPRRAADSADRAYEAIRKRVIDFGFLPEQRINEVQLARELDCSRTPVRQALARLASEGFLIQTPNRGFSFRGLDTGELVQLFELRSIVETGGFELACQRASDEAIAGIVEFWDRARERYRDQDADEILGLDEGFHQRISALSGNQELERYLAAINARIRFIRRVQIQLGRQHSNLIIEHGRILDALRQRDAQAGCALLKAHISMTIGDAQAALKEALFKAWGG